MAQGKDYKNALQEAGSSTGQDGDSGNHINHPEIESKVQSKPPPAASCNIFERIGKQMMQMLQSFPSDATAGTNGVGNKAAMGRSMPRQGAMGRTNACDTPVDV